MRLPNVYHTISSFSSIGSAVKIFVSPNCTYSHPSRLNRSQIKYLYESFYRRIRHVKKYNAINMVHIAYFKSPLVSDTYMMMVDPRTRLFPSRLRPRTVLTQRKTRTTFYMYETEG